MNFDKEAMENKKKQKAENLQKIGKKILVASGKGGVGKSTVCINIAQAFAMKGYKVGILDIDIHGPSIAKMSGISGERLRAPEGENPMPIKSQDGIYVLSIASMLESPDQPLIWRGPLKMKLIEQFAEDISWPELDYLFIDSPPGTGDEPLSLLQVFEKIDGVVIVSTPQEVSYLDVRKAINFAKELKVPILGIVENMDHLICPHCGERIDIFSSGEGERTLMDFGLDLLGKIPIDVNISYLGDKGKSFVKKFKDADNGKIFINIADKINDKIGKNGGK